MSLLHARLAIVDFDERAHQPFVDSNAGVAIAFVGEVYNYRELRKELKEYDFRTDSDTEVALAAYLLGGIAGFRALRGMFAFAIADLRTERVLLVRDPIGKKPLFVANWRNGTYFGSSVVPLVAASNLMPRVRPDLLEAYWHTGHAPPDTGILQGCEPVQPGEVLELDWDGVVRDRHSSLPSDGESVTSRHPEEAQERFSLLLAKSVRRRLTNNPNPVCLLSGGIDSTVVAAELKRQGVGAAITLGAMVPLSKDEGFARYAARRLKMPLQVVRPKLTEFASEVEWAIDLQDEPLGIMAFFPLAVMVRAAREYGKILITGDGGDEVFLGYGTPSDWVASPGSEMATSPCPNTDIPMRRLLPGWMSQWGRRTAIDVLVGHMFTKLDRATAEQGVEARCPLLDWDLLAFARTLSPAILFRNERPKSVLRHSLAQWPVWFVHRRKMGFSYSLRWIWAARRYDGLRELVHQEALDAFAEFLPSELRRPASQWKARTIHGHFADIWKLLCWSRFEARLQRAVCSRNPTLSVFTSVGCQPAPA